jgi:hypothetical protein
VTLLNGEREEIILREKTQLNFIAVAVQEAKSLGADGEDLVKLTQLSNALFSKIDLPGTKAQLKPVYSKRQAGQVRRLTKLTLVFKWWTNSVSVLKAIVDMSQGRRIYPLSAVSIPGFRRKHEKGYLDHE